MSSRAESRDRARRGLEDAVKACQSQLWAVVAAAGADYEKTFRALVKAGQQYDRFRTEDDPQFEELLSPVVEPDAVAQFVDVSHGVAAFGAMLSALRRKPRGARSVPPSSRAALELTAANLYAEAARLPASARWHRYTYLGPLLERFGTTPQKAKAKLLELHREGAITLSRADLVDAMSADVLRSSELDVGGYTFHFLAPAEGGW